GRADDIAVSATDRIHSGSCARRFSEAVAVQQGTQGEIIEIPDCAIGAAILQDEAHHMRAGAQSDIRFGKGAPALPAAGVGVGHRAGLIDPIEFNVKSSAIATGSNPRRKSIKTVNGGVDRIIEPLTPSGPTYIVSSASIS